MKLHKLISIILILLFAPLSFAEDGFVDKTINDLLQEKITDTRIIIEHQYNSKSKFSAVVDKQEEIKSIILKKFEPRYSTFKVNIQYNDDKTVALSGRYTTYIMAPIAARYIKFGDVIQQSDLTSKKIKLDSIKNGYATEDAELVGMQAKKYIAVGRMIRVNEVVSPSVIKPNDPVNIVYSSGLISLKTVGTSMGTGAVGDMIKIKNNTSGAVLLGQIINKNTVQVGGDNG